MCGELHLRKNLKESRETIKWNKEVLSDKKQPMTGILFLFLWCFCLFYGSKKHVTVIIFGIEIRGTNMMSLKEELFELFEDCRRTTE